MLAIAAVALLLPAVAVAEIVDARGQGARRRHAAEMAVDLVFRMVYRTAYRALRIYWHVAHPRTHGALVLVWHGGEVLLVRNSYVRYYSAPGGYVRRRETGRAAAARELREETGIRVDPSALALAFDGCLEWEGKRDHVEIYELDAPQRPAVEVDHREVVRAEFFEADEALALDLFPPVRQLVARRARSR